MAILPTRKVEIAFDAGVWTDISADVVAIHTRRGRNAESGAFETGTCSITVRNDGRKYDPDYAAGTYYGKLRPNRVVRLQATYNAITYPVFYGYLDRITQNPGGPNDATATIDASDLFKLLNRQELPASAYLADVGADAPVSMWPFGEPAGSLVAFDAVGTRNLDYLDSPTLGGAGLVVRDPGASATFAAASRNRAQYPAGNLITGFPFSLEVLFQVPPTSSSNQQDIYHETYGLTDSSLRLSFGTGTPGPVGALWFWMEAGGGTTNSFVYGLANLGDSAVHHVVVTATASNAVKLYVDGVDVTNVSVTTANAFPAGSGKAAWGNWPDGLIGAGTGGALQYGAVYNTALSAARVAAHNSAARTPWNGDSPGARLARIASLAAVVTTSLDAGSTTLQNTSLGGTALAYMQKVEETEIGRLFVLRDGTLRFVGRREAEMGAYLTTKSTLVDADSGAGDEYRSVSAVVDEGAIVTRATVSRDGSVAITYSDAAAVTEFKTIDETHDGLLHDSDTYSLYYAQYLVNTKKAPTSRLGALQIELPSAPATLYPNILGIELADRVQYKRKPQNTGAVTSQYMRVESIEHSTGAHYWTTLLQLSRYDPAGGVPVGYWDGALWDQAVWGL